jgi:microcystin-dependent protein
MMKELKAQQIVGLNDPTQSNQAVNKSYADLQAQAVSAGAGVWNPYQVLFSDLSASSNQISIPLFNLPAGGVIHDVIVTHSAAFGGGSLTGYSVSVGVAGSLDKYALSYDVFQSPGNQVADSSNALGIENKVSPTQVLLTATSVGDTLDHATSGEIQVYIRWSVMTQAPLAGQFIAFDEFFYSYEKVANSFAQDVNTDQYFSVVQGAGFMEFYFLQECSVDFDSALFYSSTSAGAGWATQLTLKLNGKNISLAEASNGSYSGVWTLNVDGKMKVTNGDVIRLEIYNSNSSNISLYVNVSGRSLKPVIPSLPSGLILPFGGPTVPSGYLACDGTVVSRATYASLFAAIGTAWGSGDGSTTFNLPDLRGYFLRGVSGTSGVDPEADSRGPINVGANSGNAVGSAQGSQFATHAHGVNDPGHAHTLQRENANDAYYNMTGGITSEERRWQVSQGGNVADPVINGQYTGITLQTSGGSETRPVNAYVNYIIKI